mmetsp:Transcript_21256/g.20407  ORF Transcript_21256/g.20407 Transcript_21256/m.20407 type:complete len:131 (+) Transcript_21256:1048-1440(+)
MRKDLRLGGIVGIYLVIRTSLYQVGDEILRVIIEELFTTLSEFDSQEEIFLACVLEIIGFIGPNERSETRLGIIKALFCEPSLKRIQLNCFCTLMQLGYEGFSSVVELAAKDFNNLQNVILENLLQIRTV